MRKTFLIAIILSLCLSRCVFAQEVTVTGMGTDKDGAIRDASRQAVEQVIGTFIDSRTLMRDLLIEMDEVCKKSQGFVKKIQILKEDRLNDSTYRVTARIDVDTDPNGKLIDEITMLMRLNDPRIAIIIFDDGNSSTRNEIAESLLAEKLLDMNFSHILHADQVIRLNDTELLNSIAEGRRGLFTGKRDNATDYLVVGQCKRISGPVKVAPFSTNNTAMKDSLLQVTRSNLKIDVIKYDTGEYIGTFTAQGKGLNIDKEQANILADSEALKVAAEKLGDTFKKFSAKPSNALTFTVIAGSATKLDAALNSLRSIGTIDNIQIREQAGNKIVLSIETANRPHEIVAMLKGRVKFGVVVEKMTASGCTLRIP